MNYFCSDIHGAAQAYFAMKEKLVLKNNDNLYILGDIFDGNNADPEACFDILRDIMAHDNIRLILGDHEYAHIMYYLAMGHPEEEKSCEEFLTDPGFQGYALHRHICRHLTKKEMDRYFGFLLECNMSEVAVIGDKQFYMVHGSPQLNIGSPEKWQYEVVMNGIDLRKDYSNEIASDPDMATFSKYYKDLNPAKMIVLCGHIPTKQVFMKDPALLSVCYPEEDYPRLQKVIFQNKKMMLDCGCQGNYIGKDVGGWVGDLVCIGADAAGFFPVHLND